MKKPVKNIVAILAGLITGSVVNYTLIIAGSFMIAAPAGVDVKDAASIAAGIDLFTPIHFLFPFLAHALGTLVGALTAYTVAADNKRVFALAIGLIFLAGGVANSFMIPAPLWFIITDLLLAYLPMALLAVALNQRTASNA